METSTLIAEAGKPHVYARLADAPLEGIATLSDGPVVYRESWHSGMHVLDAVKASQASAKARASLAGMYVDLPGDAKTGVEEAQPEFYHHPDLTKAKVRQYDYGSKGAVHEFQSTGKHMCMYRDSLDDVLQSVLQSKKGERMDVVLDGWTGSGKSVALYALTVAARASGWVVLYVPSASLLVRGGVFKKKSEDDTVFYTPVAARHVLRGVYGAHKDALGSLPALDGRGSLGDVCSRGLDSRDPFETVDAATSVLEGLLEADGEKGVRTLAVVDDYNYLYHSTEYHETVHRFHRRRIEPQELKLAGAFRLLDQQERKKGIVAAAATYGGPISPDVDIPLTASTTSIVRIPRFSLDEVTNMVSMYTDTAGESEPLPAGAVLKRALALTNGNGKELRAKRATLFQEDNGMELRVERP